MFFKNIALRKKVHDLKPGENVGLGREGCGMGSNARRPRKEKGASKQCKKATNST